MNKVALVTGAAKGIGKAFVLMLAKQGYDVIIHYHTSKDAAYKLKEKVEEEYNVRALCVKADISLEDEVQAMMKEIDSFGNLNIVINNAAYVQDNSFIEKTKDEFMKTLEVNVVGSFLVTKYASLQMDDGCILFISSTDATKTYSAYSIDYCASKAGVNSLAQTFSLALPKWRVYAVELPWVNTEAVMEMEQHYLDSELKRTKQSRLLEPFEVADYIWGVLQDETIKSGTILRMQVMDYE